MPSIRHGVSYRQVVRLFPVGYPRLTVRWLTFDQTDDFYGHDGSKLFGEYLIRCGELTTFDQSLRVG